MLYKPFLFSFTDYPDAEVDYTGVTWRVSSKFAWKRLSTFDQSSAKKLVNEQKKLGYTTA